MTTTVHSVRAVPFKMAEGGRLEVFQNVERGGGAEEMGGVDERSAESYLNLMLEEKGVIRT